MRLHRRLLQLLSSATPSSASSAAWRFPQLFVTATASFRALTLLQPSSVLTSPSNYVYGNQFSGDADITAYMDTWYANGTEVVFACGGGIYISAAEAAAKVGGKVIGVDVDQAPTIDAYGEGMTVTSAMKGLAPTVKTILGELILNDNWAQYAGQINTLGLVSGTDVEANYVQIPYESTQWSDTFTKDDYAALVAAMFDGTITVSNDTETEPTVQTITVDYQGNIK